MTRNAYRRQAVICAACGWQGIRKDAAKPCAKCGGALTGGGMAARAFDQGIRMAGAKRGKARMMRQDLMRGEGAYMGPKQTEDAQSGTSIFDPVLCELSYRWFCPPGGLIVDPFAGGSVRGIVAGRLGRRYLGVDLRPEQVAANEDQAAALCEGFPQPEWICGDSREILPGIDAEADLIFSCPPYGDLEVYSDDEADLSTMGHAEFVAAYRQIIASAVALLKPDRFAVFVVGDYRDGDGFYRNFPGETIAAFIAAGARLYNEAILVNAVGSGALRASRQFIGSRKLVKTHQNVLVFCNGDPAIATQAIGDCDFGDISGMPDDDDQSGAGELDEADLDRSIFDV